MSDFLSSLPEDHRQRLRDKPFAGSNVALVTPMHPDGTVDVESLQQLVEWHIDAGTHGLVAVGTTGESATLNVREHVEVIGWVIEAAAGRVPVIAGTGANSTAEAVELTTAAERAGAAAALVVTPYYNKPPQAGLIAHYQAIAAATDLPVILYNVPGRTGCDLLPETVAELAALPNIVAFKEAVGTDARIERVATLLGDALTLLSGDDATSRQAMLAGYHGVISVTANVAPAQMAQLCAAAVAGDAQGAADIDAQIDALHSALFVEPNPIPVKWALQQMQRIDSGIRLPLIELSEAQHAHVRAALTQTGLLSS